VLPEGFSFWAFLFGPLWFLFHGLWVSAILLVLVHMAVAGACQHFGVPEVFSGIASLTVSVLVGFNARDWWRLMLTRQGYRFEPVVLGRSLEQAELTLMKRAFAETGAA
jgi:hypothetical protein